MKDRVPLYPGRVKLTPVSGQENTYDMVRADQPTQEGTPLSKATFLNDTTAEMFGLDSSAVPDDIFKKLSKSVIADVATLSQLDEGSTIQLNENGKPVDYIVAKHNYESDLNGVGRTLLVRKNIVDEAVNWNNTNVNTYSGSTIDVWFNSDYKSRLDSNVQEQIGTTKFYYTVGGGNSSVSVLERSVFALSCTEHGLPAPYSTPNTEGALLPTSSLLASATNDSGSKSNQWLRSSNPSNSTEAHYVNVDGSQVVPNRVDESGPKPRPAFTLPSDFSVGSVVYIVDTKGNPVTIGTQNTSGSYVGTGTFGSSNRSSLMFDFTPKLVLIGSENGGSNYGIAISGQKQFVTLTGSRYSDAHSAYCTWTENVITWYNGESAIYQLNNSGEEYYYVAFG